MAEGAEYHHEQVAIKLVCGLCPAQSETQLCKCLDCDRYVCQACTLVHKNIPLCKNHTVIRVEPEPKMIANISRMCTYHPNNDVIYHCSTCYDLICSECVTENHEEHELTEIKTFADQKREKLVSHINTANDEIIPKMNNKIAELKEKRKINDKCKKDNLQKFKNQIHKMISLLEKMGEETKDKCIKLHQKNENEMEIKQAHLTEDVSEIQTMSYDFNRIYNTGTDIEVIRAEQEIVQEFDLLQIIHHNMDTEDLPIFIEGIIDEKIVKSMFGYVQSGPRSSTDVFGYLKSGSRFNKAEAGVFRQFQHKHTRVNFICPLADDTAFIHYRGSHDNDIVTVDGELQETIKLGFEVVAIMMTSQGDILSTSASDEQKIYKLTMKGINIGTISTAPLLPICLCESRDGNLLVSLVDERSYKPKKSSRRCVSRINMKGDVLQTYEYKKGSSLFTCPHGVSENINRDVCVVNRTSDENGHLIILYKSGLLKSTYKGQTLQKKFDPVHVSCDTVGNILVNDSYNQRVHMLNSECQFVRFVSFKEGTIIGYPWSLALDNKTGLLWVGGYDGSIFTTIHDEQEAK